MDIDEYMSVKDITSLIKKSLPETRVYFKRRWANKERRSLTFIVYEHHNPKNECTCEECRVPFSSRVAREVAQKDSIKTHIIHGLLVSMFDMETNTVHIFGYYDEWVNAGIDLGLRYSVGMSVAESLDLMFKKWSLSRVDACTRDIVSHRTAIEDYTDRISEYESKKIEYLENITEYEDINPHALQESLSKLPSAVWSVSIATSNGGGEAYLRKNSTAQNITSTLSDKIYYWETYINKFDKNIVANKKNVVSQEGYIVKLERLLDELKNGRDFSDDEINLLGINFYESFRLGQNYIYGITKNLSVEYMGYTYELGSFQVKLAVSRYGSLYLTIEPHKNNYAGSGYFHPHVSAGKELCMGNMLEGINEALLSFSVVDIFTFVSQVLTEYNDNSAYEVISAWPQKAEQ